MVLKLCERCCNYQKKVVIPTSNDPTSGGVVGLKTGRWQVPGSNPGRPYRPSRSEFSVVFSETCLMQGARIL